jgi:hypothetical protein
MTEAQREHRRQVQHARYVRKREEILAKQKVYRDTHKDEIAAKRRQRDFEKKYLRKPKLKRDRKEYDHAYYLAHHDEICEKARKRSYERRAKQHTTTDRDTRIPTG